MSRIAGLQIGKRDWLRVGRSLGNRQAAGGEHFLDGRDNPFEQPGSAERIAAAAPHRAYWVDGGCSRTSLGLARNFEGYWNNGLELEYIGDVIHEREWLSSMQKADRRRVARRQNGSLCQPVEACSCLGEAPIW